ncbi:unnamed protein product [Cylindrotheca closterium]|uniref:Uncharacterized protein n=1 Tax=Cylindrotheca closterium TaxID=2856 RepID=A0AAD2FPT9_9STRA|nr:unnamed protein product [Cylindrotheca closterium]
MMDTQCSVHQRSMESITLPTETDESASLHFQAPKEEEATTSLRREYTKEVSFNGRIRCRFFKTHITDPENLWYSKQELAGLRKLDKSLCRLAMSGAAISFVGDDDSEELSFVGLYTEAERKQRIVYPKEAKACVLAEQLQQENDYYNEFFSLYGFKRDQESIAEFYSIYSIRAAKVAHLKGLKLSWHVMSLSAEKSTNIDVTHRSCRQRSKVTSDRRPVPNSSIRPPVRGLIARLTTPAAA